MAFPQVDSVTETQSTTPATAHNVNVPATDSSKVMIMVWANENQQGTTGPSGWTELAQGFALNQATGAVYAVIDSASAGTVIVSTSASVTGAAQVYLISSWGGTIGTDIDISAITSGENNAPDPSGVTAGWGADDNLFIAFTCFGDDDETADTAPANYSNLVSTNSSAGANISATVGTATRELNAASDDPASFGISGTERWVAGTFVVRPAAIGGGNKPLLKRNLQEGHIRG